MPRVALGALTFAFLALISCPKPASTETVTVPTANPTAIAVPDASGPAFEIDGGVDRGRVVTAHPIGRFESLLRSSPDFAYGDPTRATPAEGVTVSASLVHPGTDQLAVRYVMRRESVGYFPAGGDWQYAVFGPDGKLQKQGKLALCARCHAEAPRDFLFERGSAKIAK